MKNAFFNMSVVWFDTTVAKLAIISECTLIFRQILNFIERKFIKVIPQNHHPIHPNENLDGENRKKHPAMEAVGIT